VDCRGVHISLLRQTCVFFRGVHISVVKRSALNSSPLYSRIRYWTVVHKTGL